MFITSDRDGSIDLCDISYRNAMEVLGGIPVELRLLVLQHVLTNSLQLDDFIDLIGYGTFDSTIINVLSNTTILIMSTYDVTEMCCELKCAIEVIPVSSDKFDKLVQFIIDKEITFKIELNRINHSAISNPNVLRLIELSKEIYQSHPPDDAEFQILEQLYCLHKISSLCFAEDDPFVSSFIEKVPNLQRIKIHIFTKSAHMENLTSVFQYINDSETLAKLEVSITSWEATTSGSGDFVSKLFQLSIDKPLLKVGLSISTSIPMTRSVFFQWFLNFEKIKHLVTYLHLSFDLVNSLYLDSIAEFNNLKSVDFLFSSSKDIDWDFKISNTTKSIKKLSLTEKAGPSISFNFQNLPGVIKLVLNGCELGRDCFDNSLEYLQDLELINVRKANLSEDQLLEFSLPENINSLTIVSSDKDSSFPVIKNFSNLNCLKYVRIASYEIPETFVSSLPNNLFSLRMERLKVQSTIDKSNLDLSSKNITQLHLSVATGISMLDLSILPRTLKKLVIGMQIHEIRGTLPNSLIDLDIDLAKYHGELGVSDVLNTICAKVDNLLYLQIGLERTPVIDLTSFKFNKLKSLSLMYECKTGDNPDDKITLKIDDVPDSLTKTDLRIEDYRELNVVFELIVGKLSDNLKNCGILRFFNNVEQIRTDDGRPYRFYN